MKSVRQSELVAIAIDGTPVITMAPDQPKRRRKGWFARLLLAQKISRRRAARRELAKHAHLIDLERRHVDLAMKED